MKVARDVALARPRLSFDEDRDVFEAREPFGPSDHGKVEWCVTGEVRRRERRARRMAQGAAPRGRLLRAERRHAGFCCAAVSRAPPAGFGPGERMRRRGRCWPAGSGARADRRRSLLGQNMLMLGTRAENGLLSGNRNNLSRREMRRDRMTDRAIHLVWREQKATVAVAESGRETQGIVICGLRFSNLLVHHARAFWSGKPSFGCPREERLIPGWHQPLSAQLPSLESV